MASSAQGKRSDTLGKPPHHINPRPERAKVNITRSVSILLPLAGRKLHCALYPGRRFACRWAMNFCPFGTCPLKRALIERFSACERIRVDLCDLWACSPTCFFKRIERLGYSHRSPRFAQMRCVPYAKESVRIGETCLFKRIERLVFTPTDLADFHRFLPSVGGASPCLTFFGKSRPHGQFHIPLYKPPPHYIIRCAPKPKV